MRKLRIVLVEFTPTGGLFQFAFGLGDAIARRGHDVELVTGDKPELHSHLSNFRVTPLLPSCPPDHPVGQPRPVRLLRRASCGFRYLEGWRRLLKYLDGDRVDVIQWGDLRFPVDGWLVALVAKRSRRAVQTD